MANIAEKPLTKKQQDAENKKNAIASLSKLLPSGSTVYGIVTSVSSSGMSAKVKVLAIAEGWGNDGGKRIADISGTAANAAGLKWNNDGTISVKGCGFNRVQHVVDSIAVALYKDARALKFESL